MAQTATVKEISVKEGGEGKKAWKNVRITTTDGAQIGTFEAEATSLKSGDQFEFEPEIDGKYVNIKKGTFKIVSAAPATPAAHPNGKDPGGYKRDTEGIQFEYNLKAQLQHHERVSIEAQTAYIKIMELTIAGLPTDATFKDLYAKALRWAGQRLDAAMVDPQTAPTPITTSTPSPAEATTPAGQRGPAQDATPEPGIMANASEVFNYGMKVLHFANRQFMLSVPGVQEAHDMQDWAKMVELLRAKAVKA